MVNTTNLLDFIAKPESGGDYNIVYGGIPVRNRPSKPLTQMTIDEVIEWQRWVVGQGSPSSAAGKYQIIRPTLVGLWKEAGLKKSDIFSEANQDRMAVTLLNRRGLQDYLKGKTSKVKFGDNLAKEWASLPAMIKDRKGRPARGQSYYAGDGLNRSHVTGDEVLAAIDTLKETVVTPTTKPTAKPAFNFMAAIRRLLRGC